MNTLIKPISLRIDLLWLIAACLLPGIAQAQVNPVIALFTVSNEVVAEHDRDDPLLLYVIVSNPQALTVLQQNERNLRLQQRFQNSDVYTQMSDEERQAFLQDIAISEIPTIALGNTQTSVVAMVQFLVRDDQGKKISLSVKPLASNDMTPQAVELGHSESLLFKFAVSTEQLNQLPVGTYIFTAALDASEQQQSWNSVVYSNVQSVALIDSGKTPDAHRLKHRGLYLLADYQFQAAETNARSWIDIDPDSIDAWLQLGQALHGRNQAEAALDALRTAENKFRIKYGNRPAELPEQLERLIAKIESENR